MRNKVSEITASHYILLYREDAYPGWWAAIEVRVNENGHKSAVYTDAAATTVSMAMKQAKACARHSCVPLFLLKDCETWEISVPVSKRLHKKFHKQQIALWGDNV